MLLFLIVSVRRIETHFCFPCFGDWRRSNDADFDTGGMMPYLVEGWTDDDPSASNHWTNTEYHSCEVGRTRFVTSQSFRSVAAC